MGKLKHIRRGLPPAVPLQEIVNAVHAERHRCANLAHTFYERCLKDGMLAAAHSAQEIEVLIRSQP